ncbi:MAG: hypothetical protein RL636_738 [Verrucomicrobiota bacterium]
MANANQLFNTMDPSPFHERDLDHDAEEFIVSWAREQSPEVALRLRIVLKQSADDTVARMVQESVKHYFEYRAQNSRREVKELMREGRTSLLIGLVFLGLMLAIRSCLPETGMWSDWLREGLIISGWVALWKPIDIHLYRWWPIRRLRRLQDRLAACPVEVAFEP